MKLSLQAVVRRPGNGAVVLAGNMTYAFAQFALLALLAYFSGLEQVGLYSTALAITAPIQLGLAMNMRSVRVVRSPQMFRFGSYLTWSLTSGAFAVLLATNIGLILFGPGRETVVLTAVATIKAIESVCELLYGELQRLGRLDLIARSQMYRSIILILTATLLVVAGRDISTLVLTLTAIMGVFLVGYQLPVTRRQSDIPWRVEQAGALGALLRILWPLGISAAVTSLNGSLPRILAYPILGAQAAGVLALISYPTTVMTLLGNSLGQSVLKPLRDARAAGDYARVKLIVRRAKLIVLSVGVAATALIAAILLAIGLFAELSIPRGIVGAAAAFMAASTAAALSAVAYYQLTSGGTFRFHPVLSASVTVVALPTLWAGATFGGLVGTGIAVTFYYTVQYFLWTAVDGRLARGKINRTAGGSARV